MAVNKIAKAKDANGEYMIPVEIDAQWIEQDAKLETIYNLIKCIIRRYDCELSEDKVDEAAHNFTSDFTYGDSEGSVSELIGYITDLIYEDEMLHRIIEKVEEVKEKIYEITYEVNASGTVYIKARNADEAEEIFNEVRGDIACDVELDYDNFEIVNTCAARYEGISPDYDRSWL